jgi:hypothetical protein
MVNIPTLNNCNQQPGCCHAAWQYALEQKNIFCTLVFQVGFSCQQAANISFDYFEQPGTKRYTLKQSDAKKKIYRNG